jgi:hypothetical protein
MDSCAKSPFQFDKLTKLSTRTAAACILPRLVLEIAKNAIRDGVLRGASPMSHMGGRGRVLISPVLPPLYFHWSSSRWSIRTLVT